MTEPTAWLANDGVLTIPLESLPLWKPEPEPVALDASHFDPPMEKGAKTVANAALRALMGSTDVCGSGMQSCTSYSSGY